MTFYIYPLLGRYTGLLKIRNKQGGYIATANTREEVIEKLILLSQGLIATPYPLK